MQMQHPAGPAARPTSRSIGSILVDSGRLTAEAAERIMRLQRENNMRFGEAGIALGLLTQADIDQAISSQFEYAYLPAGDTRLDASVVAAFRPFSPVVEQLRALRSQIMLRWLSASNGNKMVAICGVQKGDGRSFTAANLAVVFAQLGERTLLIDADLRQPSQHTYFRLDNRAGLANVLAGRAGAEVVQKIGGLDNLSVMPAGTVPPNPQELLAREHFPELLKRVSQVFDVVILDTTAASVAADAQMVATRAQAAVLVAREGATPIHAAQGLAQSLQEAGVNLLGAVLNEH